MAATAAPPRASLGTAGAGVPRPRRGRRWSLVWLGGVLVIACVLVFAATQVRLGHRVAVVAVARDLSAGQVLTAADLRQVLASNDPTLGLVPVSLEAQVVGRPVVVPLPAGVLLTRSLIGGAVFPPAGEMSASVSLKPGQFPADLAAGAHVAVFVAADPTAIASRSATSSGKSDKKSSSGFGSGIGTGSGAEQFEAVVLSVQAAVDGQGSTVVSLLIPAEDGPVLAGAPSDGVVLMATSASGG
jgi:hypothetical protein